MRSDFSVRWQGLKSVHDNPLSVSEKGNQGTIPLLFMLITESAITLEQILNILICLKLYFAREQAVVQ